MNELCLCVKLKAGKDSFLFRFDSGISCCNLDEEVRNLDLALYAFSIYQYDGGKEEWNMWDILVSVYVECVRRPAERLDDNCEAR